jgi:hypothetical protein
MGILVMAPALVTLSSGPRVKVSNGDMTHVLHALGKNTWAAKRPLIGLTTIVK